MFDKRQRGSRNRLWSTRIVELAAMACDPVKQAGDGVVGAQAHGGLERRLLPAGPGLEPEDGGGDGLASVSRVLAEQAFGDLGVGLRLGSVELGAVVLLQRRLAEADHAGDLVLGDAVGGQ